MLGGPRLPLGAPNLEGPRGIFRQSAPDSIDGRFLLKSAIHKTCNMILIKFDE
jgi:hypothetical protein